MKQLQLPPLNRKRKSEDDFWDDLIKGGNELNATLVECLKHSPINELTPIHKAVLMGQIVRLYKLFDTFLFLICDHRMEVSMIIARSICDTALDILYFLNDDTDTRLDEYITTSLATSKKIYEEIKEDEIHGKGDSATRERIKKSIEDDFEISRLSLSDIQSTKWRRKDDVRTKAKDLNLEGLYVFLYKSLSRTVHGNWTELIKYHLKIVGNTWSANPDYAVPRPQLMTSLPLLIAIAGRSYSEDVIMNEVISKRFEIIIEWFEEISKKLVKFLSSDS